MKRIIQIVLILLPTLLVSQFSEYTSNFINYDGQTIQTASATLDYDVESIENYLKGWMADYYDVKFEGNAVRNPIDNIISVENVLIPSISEKPIKIDFKLDETIQGETLLNVFAQDYNGVYISYKTNQEQFLALENVVHEFLADYITEFANVQEVQNELVDESNK